MISENQMEAIRKHARNEGLAIAAAICDKMALEWRERFIQGGARLLASCIRKAIIDPEPIFLTTADKISAVIDSQVENDTLREKLAQTEKWLADLEHLTRIHIVRNSNLSADRTTSLFNAAVHERCDHVWVASVAHSNKGWCAKCGVDGAHYPSDGVESDGGEA